MAATQSRAPGWDLFVYSQKHCKYVFAKLGFSVCSAVWSMCNVYIVCILYSIMSLWRVCSFCSVKGKHCAVLNCVQYSVCVLPICANRTVCRNLAPERWHEAAARDESPQIFNFRLFVCLSLEFILNYQRERICLLGGFSALDGSELCVYWSSELFPEAGSEDYGAPAVKGWKEARGKRNYCREIWK